MALEIAKTKNGLIRGVLQEGANAGITVFKKVPYAKPPIGALRFKPAEPVADWEGVYDGTSYAPAEFQTLCEGAPYLTDFYFNDWPALSEDCLYLSVTTGRRAQRKNGRSTSGSTAADFRPVSIMRSRSTATRLRKRASSLFPSRSG